MVDVPAIGLALLVLQACLVAQAGVAHGAVDSAAEVEIGVCGGDANVAHTIRIHWVVIRLEFRGSLFL